MSFVRMVDKKKTYWKEILLSMIFSWIPISCSHSGNNVRINPSLIEGEWHDKNHSSIVLKFENGRYYDPIEVESRFYYKINSDSLIIDNEGWGRQTFRILKLSKDSLHLKLIRQEIFDSHINEEVTDDEIREFIKANCLDLEKVF